jgi:hypothetical protein
MYQLAGFLPSGFGGVYELLEETFVSWYAIDQDFCLFICAIQNAIAHTKLGNLRALYVCA